ncbi:response regulator [Xanthomarina sp. F2636L]|uniref:response regulator n=1 Tax=Xanthomarina sp. F2636L TaxID=2996018 RepID=UPI00225E176C|nr:response regulator [Xanthomarina sp. F2636L]MCX7550970.1 response regulator [Xanthomarina sp. F2636L]
MIKNVMLIDDNKIDLFVNQRIIEIYNPEVNIRTFNNGMSAISFFKLLELNVSIKSLVLPEVVFLDVNMPEMNGFNFFEEYRFLNIPNKGSIDIYMLSSSICPKDIQKAKEETFCSGYITKPLTVEKIKNLLKREGMKENQQFRKII